MTKKWNSVTDELGENFYVLPVSNIKDTTAMRREKKKKAPI